MPEPARGAVKARDDPEFHLGQAKARALFAVRDAIMAGESKLQAAAQAEAVDCGHGGNGQPLDAVENRGHGVDRLCDFRFGLEVIELADVGSGDETLLLAGHENQAADPLVARAPSTAETMASSSSTGSRPERVLRLALRHR